MMQRGRVRALFLLSAIPFLGFVCGNHLPFVRNDTNQTIHIAAVLSDGRTVAGEIPPSGVLGLSDDDVYPETVTITVVS